MVGIPRHYLKPIDSRCQLSVKIMFRPAEWTRQTKEKNDRP